uniref:hypothetical protein n=1 Tax=Nocardiopsis chromatogenes TaxID=280239 RepID=UPI00195522A3|nr:hypothetical protein [Nocardiopsis chromatogenes]
MAFALTGAKADERTTLAGMLADAPGLAARCPGQTLIAGKNYYGRDSEQGLARAGPLGPGRGCSGRLRRTSGRRSPCQGSSFSTAFT